MPYILKMSRGTDTKVKSNSSCAVVAWPEGTGPQAPAGLSEFHSEL